MTKDQILKRLEQIRKEIDFQDRRGAVAFAVYDDKAEMYLAYEEIKHLTEERNQLESKLDN
jgi:hypothetical protein